MHKLSVDERLGSAVITMYPVCGCKNCGVLKVLLHPNQPTLYICKQAVGFSDDLHFVVIFRGLWHSGRPHLLGT